MSASHYAVALEADDGGEAPSQDAVRRVLEAAFPRAHCRVREGVPKVLVVVPADEDEPVIVSTDGRIGAMILDARSIDADSLQTARDRIAGNDAVELGSTHAIFTRDRDHAVRLLDDMIAECSHGHAFG